MEERPHVTGTFLQPNVFAGYVEADWERHFAYLMEAGMDTVIVQWIAESPYGELKETFYPMSFSWQKAQGCVCHEEFLRALLSAAQKMGMKVFVGLNISDEWWEIACSQDEWNRTQAELGGAIARDILTQYGEAYPDALAGWYFSWEMFNGMFGQEELAAAFLNLYVDALNEMCPEMPILLSPFVRSAGGAPETAKEEWKKVFALSHLRAGDIFCCQDAVGAEHIGMEQLEGYFAALKEAVDTKEGLLFWANTECFRKVSEGVFAKAPVSRFIRQMEIARPYVSGYVTFAYSHYYAPDFTGCSDEHEEYLRYLRNGEKREGSAQ